MIRKLLPLTCLIAITIAVLSPRANAQDANDSGTYDVFYDRLAPEGHWFYEDDYGYVWQPNAASESDWRPYSDGHWVWTDRGWCWVSNENFGWATYHYGRWVRVSGAGWVWIPGDEWAPAWVSWRQSDDGDYCGWAPLPPECTVSAGVGVSSWVDSYFDIGPVAFTFVRFHDFWRPSYRGYYLPEQQNVTIINRSTNITNISYNNTVINNYGPQYQTVAQVSQQQGHPLETYKVNYAAQTQPNAGFKTAVQGNQLNVVAPPQKLNPVATKEPTVTKQLGKAQVERGWQNVPSAQAQQLKQKFAQQAPPPANLPPKPAPPPKPQIQTAGGKPGSQPGAPPPQPGQPGKPGTVQQPVPGAAPQTKLGTAQQQSPAAEKPGAAQQARSASPAAKAGAAQQRTPVTSSEQKQQSPSGARPGAAQQAPSASPAAKPGAAQQRTPVTSSEQKQAPTAAQQGSKPAGATAAEQQRAEKAKTQEVQKAQQAPRAAESQQRPPQEVQKAQQAPRAAESQQRPPQEVQRPQPQREAPKEQPPARQKPEDQRKREQPSPPPQ
jgi:hypothetical protein